MINYSTAISEKYQILIKFLAKNRHLAKQEISNKESLVEFMQDYEYDHSRWPIIITRSLADEFDRVGTRVLKLAYQALHCYFGGDSKKFSTYFNAPAVLYELILSYFNDDRMLLCRHDFLISNGVIKLLEINTGSNIGGWQLDWFDDILRERLNSTLPGIGDGIKHTNTLNQFLIDASEIARKLKPNKSEYNILVIADLCYFGMIEPLIIPFHENAKTIGFHAKIIISQDFELLTISKQNVAYFCGKEVDVIYMLSKSLEEASSSLWMQLTACAMTGNLYFPDSPACFFMGNKKILSLLHEVKGVLLPEDREFIDTHIPFSLSMDSERLHGESILEYINYKDKWVIKKARSMQGADVFIGHKTSNSDWEVLFNQYKGDGDWILQEYCLSDDYIIANMHLGLVEHHCIWGAFYSNGRYVSTFARAMPSSGGTGIINSAKGACEVFVFEESRLLHSMVL